MCDLVRLVWVWISRTPHRTAAVLESGFGSLGDRPPGVAEADVFPLPQVRLTRSWLSQASTTFRQGTFLLLSLWIAFLNVAYAGAKGETVCSLSPSAAQTRCIDSRKRRASLVLQELEGWGGGELRRFLDWTTTLTRRRVACCRWGIGAASQRWQEPSIRWMFLREARPLWLLRLRLTFGGGASAIYDAGQLLPRL